MSVLRLSGVSRSFRGVPVLTGVDLELQPGRIYGLLGPNGVGKTTVLRIALGMLLPDEGTVALFGGTPDDRARSRVGYVPEIRALPDLARLEEALVFMGRMQGMSSARAVQEAGAWLQRMDLADRARAQIRTLSNGEQQKVQLCLALLGDPDLLVLDEPLTALDPAHQETVVTILRERVAEGATVLLATHRLHEAEAVVEHLFLLHRGRMRLDADLRETLAARSDGRYRVVAPGALGWLPGPGVEVLATPAEDTVVFRCASLAPVLARAAAADARISALVAAAPTLQELYLQETAG